MDRYTQSLPPAFRIGADFGNGSLVIGIAEPDGTGFRTMEFSGWSQEMPGTGTNRSVHTVPSLIHYDKDGSRIIGDEVVRAGKEDHPATVRWIRKYLLDESPARVPAGDARQVTIRDAATDFFTDVLTHAVRECPRCATVGFTIPPDVPDWYSGWLGSIADASGFLSWYLLSEPVAVIAGYGLVPRAGNSYLIIHWDETVLTASFVVFGEAPDHAAVAEIRMTGSAAEDTGCRDLDNWITQDILFRNFRKYTGAKAQQIRDAVSGRTAEIFRHLVIEDNAVTEFIDPFSATTVSVRVSRDDIDRILLEHGFPAVLERTIARARAAARARGYNEEQPDAILMTGRGCMIPAVTDFIKKQFAGIPVYCDHPLDAVARGTVLHRPRTNRPDRIKNDYALRYWDPKSQKHRFRFLVRSGARYPSAGQLARITISAAYDGQTRLGIPLYEISTSPEAHGPSLDLVFDPAGGARPVGPPEDAGNGSRPVPVNESTPTLLVADPPATKGEPRFELTFVLDREKQLCVTARDLVTGILVKKDAPVHTLT
ncbi:MAG TPA: hypothetical protein PKM50_05525 [Methanoregula sp.]|nr:hypothetical protein [Methanoregula sp.]